MNDSKKAYKILVVDDDKVARLMVCSIFKDKRYAVTQADSGEMALEILPEVMPDLMLLDIQMGGINGFEVLKRIRADERLKYIKIILLSSETDINERLKGYESGTDDYMTKPFVGGELLAKAEVFMRMAYIEEKNVSLEELVRREVEKHKLQEEYMLNQAKLISMGDMVLAIAHYWRQPLNALGIAVQDVMDAFLHNELTEDYLKKSVDSSMRHISFMSAVIENFQRMINDDKSDTLFNVNYALKDVIDLNKDKLRNEDVNLCVNSVPYSEYFQADAVEYYIRGRDWILKQTLSSLFQNAFDSILKKRQGKGCLEEKDSIKIKIWNVGNSVNISVADSGAASSGDNPDRAFEPYYNAKDRIEEDTEGLDLYFSRTLIEKQLGGKLYARNSENGTIFFIEIPCAWEEEV